MIDLSKTNSTPRIEILPLIDVVFLLLVFFIYAMVHMEVIKVVNVDLPHATAMAQDVDEPIVLSIDHNSRVFYEKTPVSLSQLSEQLNQFESAKTILINGDRQANLEIMIKLIELFQVKGFQNVSFRCVTNDS